VQPDSPPLHTGDGELRPGETLPLAAEAPTTVRPTSYGDHVRTFFDRERFLTLLREWILFFTKDDDLKKTVLRQHQTRAVVKVVERCRDPHKTRGLVWHTQGSGKSLTMAFYAGRIIREPAMGNPTLVVLTDRNDLDDQLFATFARCRDLLRQPPMQAESRAQLRELLSRAAGGVVFTTIHKFFPEEKGDRHPTLSDRRNIVVMADEAHRSQRLGTLQEVACEPFVGKAHRQSQHLLQKNRQHEHRPAHLQHGPHRSRRVEDTARTPARRAAQVNKSLITLPELAIFIGRPFLAVKVVSREMPSDLSTLAITSWDE
jgi:hypothetical protein